MRDITIWGFRVSINGGKICLGSVDGYDGRENALHGRIQVGVKNDRLSAFTD